MKNRRLNNKKRIIHKVIISIVLVAIVIAIQLLYNFLYANYQSYDWEWMIIANRIYLGIVAILEISMWSLECQIAPQYYDIDWLDNFIEGCFNLGSEIEQFGARGRKTYSWPLAIPAYIVGILSFGIMWMFVGGRWLTSKIS